MCISYTDLTAPICAVPLSVVPPEGITIDVRASTISLLPRLGLRTRSLTSVETMLSFSLRSELITRSVGLEGPILSSSISSNVSGQTADPQKVSSALPLFTAPDV